MSSTRDERKRPSFLSCSPASTWCMEPDERNSRRGKAISWLNRNAIFLPGRHGTDGTARFSTDRQEHATLCPHFLLLFPHCSATPHSTARPSRFERLLQAKRAENIFCGSLSLSARCTEADTGSCRAALQACKEGERRVNMSWMHCQTRQTSTRHWAKNSRKQWEIPNTARAFRTGRTESK